MGTKFKGARIHPATAFQTILSTPSTIAPKLSANRMRRPTQPTISSSVIRELVITRPFSPKATYAMSAKFANELSTSMHLARRPAVYLVMNDEETNDIKPMTHPVY